MKGVNTLRVEACALGRFYCSGNNWTRIGGRAERLNDLAADSDCAPVVTSRYCAKRSARPGSLQDVHARQGKGRLRSYPSSARRGARQAVR